MLFVCGLLDGLGGEDDVIGDDFAGEAIDPGRLGAEGFPVFIKAPQDAGKPDSGPPWMT